MLHIGCSGWSYDDWKGVLYPRGYVDKLKYYSAHFNTVEINSTFYSVPPESMVDGWIDKVKGRKNFLFSVKLPGELSHELILHDPARSGSYLDAFQSMVLYPLRNAGRLGCILLQLPPFFRMKHMKNLEEMFKGVERQGYTYFVEFRNREFYGNREVQDQLEGEGIGTVLVDSPDWHLKWDESSLDTAYLRFHGYNTEGWRNPSAGKIERYDYLYTKDEMERFASMVSERQDRFSDVYIYFNNHPSGKAARNALNLAGLMGHDHGTDQKLLY